MLGILLYCRPGFENDCANEIQDKASELEVFGFIKTVRNGEEGCIMGYPAKPNGHCRP